MKELAVKSPGRGADAGWLAQSLNGWETPVLRDREPKPFVMPKNIDENALGSISECRRPAPALRFKTATDFGRCRFP